VYEDEKDEDNKDGESHNGPETMTKKSIIYNVTTDNVRKNEIIF